MFVHATVLELNHKNPNNSGLGVFHVFLLQFNLVLNYLYNIQHTQKNTYNNTSAHVKKSKIHNMTPHSMIFAGHRIIQLPYLFFNKRNEAKSIYDFVGHISPELCMYMWK